MILSTLFTTGVVLQHGMPVPVWGTCTPNAHVVIQIAEKTAKEFFSTSGDFL